MKEPRYRQAVDRFGITVRDFPESKSDLQNNGHKTFSTAAGIDLKWRVTGMTAYAAALEPLDEVGFKRRHPVGVHSHLGTFLPVTC
jgi:hypothetical protein